MRVEPSEDELIALTAAWSGDRFPGGRPRVPDDVLTRLATTAQAEHAWSILDRNGYRFQYATGWQETQPGKVIAGRALTAQFLPLRPDYHQTVITAGAAEGHLEGDRQNSWVIQSLTEGDVMVVDIFGKVVEGTVIGDNLGSAVAARTRTGAVIHGGVRDLVGLRELTGVNIYFRNNDPTPIRNVTLAGINTPVLIGTVTVLPGDVILGTPGGITAIPPQFAEEICVAAEEISHRDIFGKLRLTEGTYTSAEIDVGKWPAHIEADYEAWSLDNPRTAR